MQGNLLGAAAIAVAFLVLFYVNKWDLVDMTGLAKKNAIQGMPQLAKSLSMEHTPGLTDLRQGELLLKSKLYELTVLPDNNRISVSFEQPLGIYLLDQIDRRKSSRPNALYNIDFSSAKLNHYFIEHLATDVPAAESILRNPKVEQALIAFIDSWNGRKLSSFSLRDDTLHVVFAYRDYLPVPLISKATKQIQNIADTLTEHQLSASTAPPNEHHANEAP